MATPWTRFRNLCSYYIDCVKYSEKRQKNIRNIAPLMLYVHIKPMNDYVKDQCSKEIVRGRSDYLVKYGEKIIDCSQSGEVRKHKVSPPEHIYYINTLPG